VLQAARRAGVPARAVGTTGGAALTLAGGDAISMGELIRAHEDWLPGLMAARHPTV
jgi:phosphoribosylformylglycinamidine synthase